MQRRVPGCRQHGHPAWLSPQAPSSTNNREQGRWRLHVMTPTLRLNQVTLKWVLCYCAPLCERCLKTHQSLMSHRVDVNIQEAAGKWLASQLRTNLEKHTHAMSVGPWVTSPVFVSGLWGGGVRMEQWGFWCARMLDLTKFLNVVWCFVYTCGLITLLQLLFCLWLNARTLAHCNSVLTLICLSQCKTSLIIVCFLSNSSLTPVESWSIKAH